MGLPIVLAATSLAALLSLGPGAANASAQVAYQEVAYEGDGEPAAPATCAAEGGEGSSTASALRFFFIADVHSAHEIFERFAEKANRERPDLVLEGGDFVHDGTWAELRRAYEDRRLLEPHWRLAKGNHDARRRGPHPVEHSPPPEFEAFTCRGVRFILLDNHEQMLTGAQFSSLESDLEAHRGEPIVVVMHVPPVLTGERFITRLRHLLPMTLAEPTMEDPEEVARFTDLMARHDVLAVLAAHAHVHDEQTIDGVRYIAAGTAGGLTPGLGIPWEYLDVEIREGQMEVRRRELRGPARDPVRFIYRSFRFFARVNGFSHAEQGWNFVPSTSVQWRGGMRITEAGGGENGAVWGMASFEHPHGETGRVAGFGEIGLSAAPRELAGHFAAGYKVRPVGDFNRNAFVGAGGTLNAGMLRGSGTAGVGALAEVGFEWRSVTAGLQRNWATNHRSTSIVLGRRF